MNKTCCKCRITKLYGEFHRHTSTTDGRQTMCKACKSSIKPTRQQLDKAAEATRKHRASLSAEQKRDVHYRQAYGFSLEEYRWMLDDQGYVCKICGKMPTKPAGHISKLHVDHCHETGKVRGLLCNLCNTRLGVYEKNKDKFEQYIRRFK